MNGYESMLFGYAWMAMKLCCLGIHEWLRNYVLWVYTNGSETMLFESIYMALKLCCFAYI